MKENQHVFRISAIINVLNNTYTEELEKEHESILGKESLDYIKNMTVEDVVDFVDSLTLTDELKSNSDFTSLMSTLYYQLYLNVTEVREDLLEKSEDYLVLSAKNGSPRSLFILGNNQFLGGKSEEGLTNMIMARNLGYHDAYLFTEVYKWHIAIITSHNNDYYRVEDYDEDQLQKHMIMCAEGSTTFDIDTIDKIENVILKTNEAYKKIKYLYGICKTVNIDMTHIKINDMSVNEFLNSIMQNSYTVINNAISRETKEGFAFLIDEPLRLEKGIIDIEACVGLMAMKKNEMICC